MYSTNYIEGLIAKERYSLILLRVMKIINLLAHIAIVLLFIVSYNLNETAVEFNDKITTVKGSILNKMGKFKINQMEKEWDFYYYRLKAIKELNDRSTKYAFKFKELGQYLPEGDYLVNFDGAGNGMSMDLIPNEEKLETLSSFYDYAEIINSAFEKSTYMKKEFSVKNTKESKVGNKKFNLLNLKI